VRPPIGASILLLFVNPDVPQQKNEYRKRGTFTQWSSNSAIKNNGFMKFLDKWMYLVHIILSVVTQSQKKSLDMHSLVSDIGPET
jgi:hypothetical protein